tara:strand:- start:395 stop:592 length:198 start_codon:yes stop_codon:yes gene_type:complete
MSSLKRTKTTTPEVQEESYVEEVNTAVEEQHIAQHPMLLAMETHYATAATKEDHLERYTEVNPFE